MKDNKRYDVGIFGLWYGHNYGSIITYYALNNVINSLGYSTVMIKNPLGSEVDINSLRKSHALRFASVNYDITPLYRISEMHKLNDLCDKFLLGSDQMWHYGLSRPYKQSYFFDFVDDDKIKVAYATSFGREKYNAPADYKAASCKNLNRFTAISVRDDFSKEICGREFGINVEQVIDPVFLCSTEKYDELIEKAEIKYANEYFFAYILDPSPEWGEAIINLTERTGKKAIIIFNEGSDKQEAIQRLNISGNSVEYFTEADVCEWLYCFKNASFVITDSFHGACFSIIFNRMFVVLRNNGRGGRRFDCLLKMAGLESQMVTNVSQIKDLFDEKISNSVIDFEAVKNRLNYEKEKGNEWLKNALEGKIQLEKSRILEEAVTDVQNSVSAEPIKLHPDIERCRMVAGLLRDYGIRHIVVSSGARDVSLARLFERNDCFITHNVTDERSAAYYALGIATKLKEPVAITCTSGTAVSNYLPGITEAYYMQVPIAVISGDRYPCYLNQMEAQKIDHIGALASVVKASVDLPLNWDGMGQWECRRKISEALLEMTHHGTGPVHINVPMNFLENKYPPDEALQLPAYRHIDRITSTDSIKKMDETLEKLKRAKRILIISGQALPMSDREQKNFDNFCSKFNCVVVTDHLSNLHNKYTINPFNMLRKTGVNFFAENFMPDLVLYFGGKRVLNCPLQGKMRSISRKFEFWRIDPDGKIADLYRTLTHVYEMPSDYFFSYFADRAGDISNDNVYYNIWKEKALLYPQVDYTTIEKFDSFYTIGKTMSVLPQNSLLHLGVGTSFNRAHFYDLDSSITVYCNMGTNGIDGSASAFMGQACVSNNLCFLFIGDLSFFYDMNSIWNKPMRGNIRILLNNDGGAGFLRHFETSGITQQHNAVAKGWVESLGFTYLSAKSKGEFDKNVERFVSDEDVPMFMEVFVE